MFICNFKINQKKILKFLLLVFVIILLAIFAFFISKICKEAKNIGEKNVSVSDVIPSPDIAEITSENYTNILKEVHENLDTYIGQKISIIGYVYRVDDFKDNQFVIARDMKINNKNQTVVIGFLCQCDEVKDFDDNTWVKITGEIQEGKYYDKIPIIKVQKIEKSQKPEDAIVSTPNDDYVPTSIIY